MIEKLKSKFYFFLQQVFPSTIVEMLLFLFFILSYGILGHEIAMNYRIIFDDRIPWDGYFSFDNRSIVMTGGGFERHPLSNYFFEQLRSFAYLFSGGKKNDIFRFALACFSNISVSLALIQVYKYLKNIIQLPTNISVLLVLMTSLFSTSILLSFTPETYTYTFLLLCAYNYYVAQKIKNQQTIPFLALSVAGICIGGLTITNIIKVYFPLLFDRKIYWNWKKIITLCVKSFLSIGIFLLLFLNRLNFDYQRILSKTTEQYEKFSQPKVTPIWDMIVSWFFGGNVLFSRFFVRDYHSPQNFQYKAIFMDVYSSSFNYIFVALFLIIILWSYFKNLKNTWVQILMISFLIDIVIHTILKFGLHTSYIYGGHFVFVIPLLWGWLLQSYRQQRIFYPMLISLTLIFFSYLLMNNIFRMTEFFSFLQHYYR